ncbi:MAG: arylesterase [Gammaproteobacteria bacterium]
MKLLLLINFCLLPTLTLASPNIIVLGDSLSAGYGINQKDSWVSLLKNRISTRKIDYTIINASISGETTSGGLSRIGSILDQEPEIIVLELGANDGLRGLPLGEMKQNLTNIIEMGIEKNSKILLVGMRIPPNYGRRYSENFALIYVELAKKYQIQLVPFLLAGLDNKAKFQADGLHPTAEAQTIILENVWLKLKPMLSPDR